MITRSVMQISCALSLACLLFAAPAQACWWKPICLVEALPADGKVVPANMKTLGLRLCGYPMPKPRIELSAERDGTSRAIEADVEEATLAWNHMGRSGTSPLDFWKLHIRAPLTPGERLVLRFREAKNEDDLDAGFNEGELTWHVGAEEPLPEQLGDLDVQQDTGVVTIAHNTSCERKINSSSADITLLPAATAQPWLAALSYELRVDGDKPWVFYDSLPTMGKYFWNSALGPGKDRLVVGCEPQPLSIASLSGFRMMPVLEPGEHRVRMIGTLPDGTEISSEEVVLDMRCPPGTSGPIFDAGVRDAGSIFSEPALETRPAPEQASCTVLTPGSSQQPWRLLLVAPLLLHRRRRGSRRVSAHLR